MSTQWNLAIALSTSIVGLTIVQANPAGLAVHSVSLRLHSGLFAPYCVFRHPDSPCDFLAITLWRSDVCFGKNAHFLPLRIAQHPWLLLCTHTQPNPLLVDGDPKITQAGMRNLTAQPACENQAGESCTTGMHRGKQGKTDAPKPTQICVSPFQLSSQGLTGGDLPVFLSLQNYGQCISSSGEEICSVS